jgi:nicotinamide mononucleotide transporter
MSVLEIIGVVVSFLGIWLTARRVMVCWPVNLMACALYFKLFLDERLYADMALQAVFGVAIVYGWIAWLKGRGGDGQVIVQPLSNHSALGGLALGRLAPSRSVGSPAIIRTPPSRGWMPGSAASALLPNIGRRDVMRQVGCCGSWLMCFMLGCLYSKVCI